MVSNAEIFCIEINSTNLVKNYENPNKVLVMVVSLSIILVATGIISTSITQHVAAQSISIPTNTTQQANCDTVGSSSAVAGSCDNTSTNNIANSGGVIDLTQPSTNTGTITVIKHVINDNDGTLQASDFTMTISTCPPNAQDVRQFPGSESGTTVAVDPAPCYNIGENFPGPIPYDISLTGDCTNVVLNAGDHKTCTITNNDRPTGTITVIKHVINDNDGTLQASDFTMRINTCPPNAQIVREFPGSESGDDVILDPAPCYNVGEVIPGPTFYDFSFTGDCTNVVLNAGDHKTCTITNNDRP